MGEKGDRRRARSRKETALLLDHLDPNHRIDRVIQCGLGDWAEGPVLLERFPTADFYAAEPIHVYAIEAWQAGFRGPILQVALWNKTGEILYLHKWRTRTSALNMEDRGLGSIEVFTLTLDKFAEYLKIYNHDKRVFQNTLLWMDCEGVELKILEQAGYVLDRTYYVLCELKDEPKLPNWPKTNEIVAKFLELGFHLKHRIGDNGLFSRT